MRLRGFVVALFPLLAISAAIADELPDSATLDSTFGTNGKVYYGNPLVAYSADYTSSAFEIADTAVQPDGKIVFAGYTDVTFDGTQYSGWVVGRLNANGSMDTGFGAYSGLGPPLAGYIFPYLGSVGNHATAIALRPNGQIVVAGNIHDSNDQLRKAVVIQYNADGSPDNSFGNNGAGATYLTPAAGDATYAGRIVLDSDGSIALAGTYFDQSANNNNFFFDRIAPQGNSHEPFQFIFGGPNADDHAFGVAIDNQGRYLASGYHRDAGGNYDCAVIRIDHDLYDVDRTFGYRSPDDYGYQTVSFDYGGDNNDSCNAVIAQGDYVILGGSAAESTYQAAALSLLDSTGSLVVLPSLTYAKFSFAYNQSNSGAVNTIEKLIVDPYETQYPYVYAIGSGRSGGSPHGPTFGIARVELPQSATFTIDPHFAGGGPVSEYFVARPDGVGLQMTSNQGTSAAFANGKLVVVGSTDSSGDIAAARFAPFDGIFKNGYEPPYF